MGPEKMGVVQGLMRELEKKRPGMSFVLDCYSDGITGIRGKVTEWGRWPGKEHSSGVVLFYFDSPDELIGKLTKYAGE